MKQGEWDICVEMHNIMARILVALCKNSLYVCVAANFYKSKNGFVKPV